ncbi:MAG: hypothetical protein OXU20_11835 [Myxococcales bacterium]|nr:hypothetical protein [Myxococcales bacterium]MDD9966660.1 hypothetical protein [Myxococcales bacterium]
MLARTLLVLGLLAGSFGTVRANESQVKPSPVGSLFRPPPAALHPALDRLQANLSELMAHPMAEVATRELEMASEALARARVTTARAGHAGTSGAVPASADPASGAAERNSEQERQLARAAMAVAGRRIAAAVAAAQRRAAERLVQAVEARLRERRAALDAAESELAAQRAAGAGRPGSSAADRGPSSALPAVQLGRAGAVVAQERRP